VFYVLLYCYTGMTDLSVGSPFKPRCAGIDDLIGFFVNTVVLRARFSVDFTFEQLLTAVSQMVREAISHCDLTFDKVVDAVRPNRDPSRGPLFQVNFRAPKEPYPRLQLVGAEAERAHYIDNETAKFDLALEIDSSTGEACYFEYCTDLFSEPTVATAVSDYQSLLAALISAPGNALTSLKVLQEIAEKVHAHRPRM
jgi:non-ribosomal peptide synthetase component F